MNRPQPILSSSERRRRSGFTLIEVLIAMLILSVGAASLLALFAAAASTHRRAVDRTEAALVAERVLSEIRALYRPGMDAEEMEEEVLKRLPEELGSYRYEATLVHPEGKEWKEGELVARVVVRWRQSGYDRAESFHTIILPRFLPGEIEEKEERPVRRLRQ